MGFVLNGRALVGGENLAIQGVLPSGIAAQGQVVWLASHPPPTWMLLKYATGTSPWVNLTLDTTGANLIVIVVGFSGSLTVTDGNHSPNWGVVPYWNAWTVTNAMSNSVFYLIDPITSSNHTFTFSGMGYASMIAMAIKGPPSLQFDLRVAATVTAPSMQFSPLTPSADNALIIASVSSNGISIAGIDSNFSTIANMPFVYGQLNACVAATLQQTTALQISPTVTLAGGGNPAAGQLLSFIPA